MGFSLNNSDVILREPLLVEHAPPENLTEGDRSDYGDLGRYTTYESVLRRLSNARVSAASLIYKNLIVDSESLYSPRHKTYYQSRHLVKNLLLYKNVVLNKSENYLLATDQESEGHFHWLTEVLPRLWLVRERAHEFVLLLPDKPYIRTIGLESLGLLGFNFANIVWMAERKSYKVPNLYHISKLSPSGQMHDEVMHELRDAFVGTRRGGTKRVYISRAGAWRRKILNDGELIAMLRNYGFQVFSGGATNLKQQVELFSECNIAVGIHGAGLSNSLFMPPGTVVELKKNELTYAYWNLAGSLGHKYYYYNGIPDSNQSLIGTGCNLTIPVARLEKEIIASLEDNHPRSG